MKDKLMSLRARILHRSKSSSADSSVSALLKLFFSFREISWISHFFERMCEQGADSSREKKYTRSISSKELLQQEHS